MGRRFVNKRKKSVRYNHIRKVRMVKRQNTKDIETMTSSAECDALKAEGGAEEFEDDASDVIKIIPVENQSLDGALLWNAKGEKKTSWFRKAEGIEKEPYD